MITVCNKENYLIIEDEVLDLVRGQYPAGGLAQVVGAESSHRVVTLRDCGDLVGICLLDVEEATVDDLVVKPRYRKYLGEMLASVREIAGEGAWTAYCRAKTSAVTVRAMARRGQLRLLHLGEPEYDDYFAEEMVEVEFQLL